MGNNIGNKGHKHPCPLAAWGVTGCNTDRFCQKVQCCSVALFCHDAFNILWFAVIDNESDVEPCKYKVTLLGVLGVGKTSLIEQFMSSEHADVFSENPNYSKENNTRYTLIYRILKIREKEDLDYLNRIIVICNILFVEIFQRGDCWCRWVCLSVGNIWGSSH